MVYVSKKPLKQETLVRISNMLITHIANIHTKPNAEKFLDEILTTSEKIMLAKRFAIIAMLNKEQSYSTIKRILRVSPVTIAKINQELENGEFDFIISQLQKTKNNNTKGKVSESFSIWLDVMLGIRIPPRGKSRWKFLDEIEKINEKRGRNIN
ncbi:hypothetical protein HON59_02650 [bacterium]|mgnify:FL=1|nr:hypothetical protein [bacterium]MBT3730063.1 hypothetical protein [bacterium]MBT4894931.1 hypothetical protein [bacterium]